MVCKSFRDVYGPVCGLAIQVLPLGLAWHSHLLGRSYVSSFSIGDGGFPCDTSLSSIPSRVVEVDDGFGGDCSALEH